MRIFSIEYTTAFTYYAFADPITTSMQNQFLTVIKKVLEERIPSDLPVEVKNLTLTQDHRLQITLSGSRKDDLTFALTCCKEITGEQRDLASLMQLKQQISPSTPFLCRGFLKSVGSVGFGMFIDIGLANPNKDILIPLHVLRKQLVKDSTLSIHEIINLYGFLDYLPVQIQLTALINDTLNTVKLEGEFSPSFLQQLKTWIVDQHDVIFSTGVPRQLIKKTIAKRGHTFDIINISRLGPLETAIICKSGTNGPGILSRIGPFLPHCRFSLFRPRSLIQYWQ